MFQSAPRCRRRRGRRRCCRLPSSTPPPPTAPSLHTHIYAAISA